MAWLVILRLTACQLLAKMKLLRKLQVELSPTPWMPGTTRISVFLVGNLQNPITLYLPRLHPGCGGANPRYLNQPCLRKIASQGDHWIFWDVSLIPVSLESFNLNPPKICAMIEVEDFVFGLKSSRYENWIQIHSPSLKFILFSEILFRLSEKKSHWFLKLLWISLDLLPGNLTY